MLKLIKNVVKVAHGLVREHVEKKLTRSPEWGKYRKAWLKIQPKCAACGGIKRLQVHHKVPFKHDPSKELDMTNYITLCMGVKTLCHIHIGHGDSYKMYNPNVEKDAADLLANPSKLKEIWDRSKASRKVN